AARRARAAVKNAIASREVSPLVVLDHATAAPDGVEGRLRVTEFLLSVPAIGTTKMQEALQRLSISPAKRLGGLGRHQRLKLREFLI
ncbi:integration host factor, actinobacterial type, partial [Klebsiella pneumoniae]|uniref:integration host factor, actinobacterial type n=1 Tax=Klebsiella pneumoniae TaxID=573 RepID=UPI003B9868BC